MKICLIPDGECGICALLKQPNEDAYRQRMRMAAAGGQKDPYQQADLAPLLAVLADGRVWRATDIAAALGLAGSNTYARLHRAKAAGLVARVAGGWQRTREVAS